jgi:hypothetical protein
MEIKIANGILNKKEPAKLYDLVKPALEQGELRDLLVEGSSAKNETFRYNCVRVLYRAIEARPDLFYSYWDRFTGMIDSPNGFHRSIAAQAIALLASADRDHKLDPLFDHYLGLLNDPKVMVSHYFLETLARICGARPDLQEKVIASLLSIDKTKHLPGRKELLKADVISTFDRLFEALPPQAQKKVSAFAKKQEESRSPKTRKAALEFEKKHP